MRVLWIAGVSTARHRRPVCRRAATPSTWSSGPRRWKASLGTDSATLARFSAEHRFIHADIDAVRAAADALGQAEPSAAMAGVRAVHETLVGEVLPHQDAEDEILFPALSRVLRNDTTVVMSRAHVEIAHQVRRLGRLIEAIGPAGPDEADIAELRRLLYGLQAILRLHTAQEEENYLSLAEPEAAPAASGAEASTVA